MEKKRLLQMKETSSIIFKNKDSFQFDNIVPTNKDDDVCFNMTSDER